MFDEIKDVGTRLCLKIIATVIQTANKEVNIPEIQKKFNAYQEKTIQFKIPDKNLNLTFRLSKEGKILWVRNPEVIDNTVVMNSNTLFSLLGGKTKVIDPADGSEKFVDYTPQMAWLRGDIQIFSLTEKGMGSTNDVYLIFTYLMKELQDSVVLKMGQKIAGILT